MGGGSGFPQIRPIVPLIAKKSDHATEPIIHKKMLFV